MISILKAAAVHGNVISFAGSWSQTVVGDDDAAGGKVKSYYNSFEG